MYKKVLVPLDGSKRAERLLPHVQEPASRYKVKVILVEAATSRSFGFAVENRSHIPGTCSFHINRLNYS